MRSIPFIMNIFYMYEIETKYLKTTVNVTLREDFSTRAKLDKES